MVAVGCGSPELRGVLASDATDGPGQPLAAINVMWGQ